MDSSHSSTPTDSQIDLIILQMARTGRIENPELETLVLYIRHLRELNENLLYNSISSIE